MPPKRGSRGHGGGEGLSSSSSHSSGGRRNFSIATFFDAASASPGRRGGTGFRLNGASSGAPATLSQMASALQDSRGRGSSNYHTNGEGDTFEHGDFSSGFSATLLDVRARILAEVAEEQEVTRGSSRRGVSKLHQHRQRALEIAFGDGNGRGSGQGPSPSQPQRFSNQRNEEEEDDGLTVSSVEFSLLCPYSRLPMTHPVRSRDCRHVQCCDLESWMVLLDKCRSLRDPKGPCPVCEQRVAASSLEVDFWMMNVAAQMPPGTRLVELDADGSYRNGDLAREKRKAMMTTEIIDATQEGDFENYLGEVIDDDVDGVSVPPAVKPVKEPLRPKRTRSQSPKGDEAHDSHRPFGGDSGAASRAAPQSPAQAVPTTSADSAPLMSVKKEVFLQQQQQQRLQREEGTASATAVATVAASPPAHRDGSHETRSGNEPSTASPPAPPLPFEPPTPSQDPGVVIVHYVEGATPRALPSQVRLWVPHCPRCQAPLLKGEDAQTEACRSCGQTTRDQWTLVRRFEESGAVSMELTPDDTLVLRGVDAASAYLFRAGFQRTPFGPPAPSSTSTATATFFGRAARATGPSAKEPHGVWTTSFPLTRVELDFLEACCHRIARGEDVDDLGATVPVPSLFRIPRRRRAGAAATGGGYRSYGATQQPYGASQAYSMGFGSGGNPSRNGSGAASGNGGPSQGFSQTQQQQQPSASPYFPLFAAR